MDRPAEGQATNNTLALKHRPRKLSEVVGQENARKALAGMFKARNVPNAIMLVGTSGIGKTTLARIVARYLNCEKGNACGKCESCCAMDSVDDHPDYQEVNASESGNIETVRALIQGARYLPKHRFRIIMLDEMHRASHAAVQALLVPVESPPKRTLWMFATTDPDKIPNSKALMGRCQVFRLSPPGKEEIARRLMDVARAEGMDWMTEKAARAAADFSEGRVRNALQLLERAAMSVAGSGKKPKPKETAALMENEWWNSPVDEDQDTAFKLLLGIYLGRPKMAAKACLDAADVVALLGRAASVNASLMGEILTGGHDKLWRSKPTAALKEALSGRKVKTRQMCGTTLEMLSTRQGLFSEGQQHQTHYAMSRMVSLALDMGKGTRK